MSGYTIRLTGDEQRDHAIRLIRMAPDYAVVTIKKGDRTLEQNAKFHAMLTDVALSKPQGRSHTPEVWKALFMNACGYAVQFEQGLSGEPFPIGFRSSRLSKHQMSELIEFIYAYGQEHGVRWSEPERKNSRT